MILVPFSYLLFIPLRYWLFLNYSDSLAWGLLFSLHLKLWVSFSNPPSNLWFLLISFAIIFSSVIHSARIIFANSLYSSFFFGLHLVPQFPPPLNSLLFHFPGTFSISSFTIFEKNHSSHLIRIRLVELLRPPSTKHHNYHTSPSLSKPTLSHTNITELSNIPRFRSDSIISAAAADIAAVAADEANCAAADGNNYRLTPPSSFLLPPPVVRWLSINNYRPSTDSTVSTDHRLLIKIIHNHLVVLAIALIRYSNWSLSVK